MNLPLPCLSLAAALAAAAPAQLPVRDLVPADSKFVFAMDLQATLDFMGRDAVRASVVRKLHEGSEDHLPADWDRVLEREWGFDPFRDLRGFLLFGDKGPHDGATLALITSGRADAAIERLRDAGVLEASRRDGIEVLELVPAKAMELFGVTEDVAEAEKPGATFYLHRFGGVGPGGGLAVLMAKETEVVLRAARALREGDTLVKSQGRLATGMRPGDLAFVEVGGAIADALGENPAAKLTSKAQRFTMQLGLRDGDVEFRAVVETAEEKDARHIAALVNGLKALVALAEPGEDVPKAAVDALMAADARADGRRVTLEVRVPRELIDDAMREVRRELGDDQDAEPERKRKAEPERRRTIR